MYSTDFGGVLAKVVHMLIWPTCLWSTLIVIAIAIGIISYKLTTIIGIEPFLLQEEVDALYKKIYRETNKYLIKEEEAFLDIL